MALSETIRSPAPGSKTLGLVGSMRESGLRLSFVARPQAVVRDKVFISPANRLGSAVQRNHAKRLQREFYRHSRDRLRELSRQAAEAACRKFVGDWEHSPGVSFGDTILGTTCLQTACLHFEQSLSYHWGLVVCREAAEAEYDERKEGQTLASDSLSAVFWPGARNPAFVVELQRYENLLESLRRPMSGQWLRLLQRAFCDEPPVTSLPGRYK
ncbi:hypothetical protein P0082_12080 [Candidatus Haliotispira prima]|uniref:Uncharacterized protein n=1 Tax=Candidatus Haliotispira prima TaxID=3034016 RepID=A0ABY8MGR6_9SPIO|nr:hypothetical protein P0082_12080 [Candidatus Haliotispira prima]